MMLRILIELALRASLRSRLHCIRYYVAADFYRRAPTAVGVQPPFEPSTATSSAPSERTVRFRSFHDFWSFKSAVRRLWCSNVRRRREQRHRGFPVAYAVAPLKSLRRYAILRILLSVNVIHSVDRFDRFQHQWAENDSAIVQPQRA